MILTNSLHYLIYTMNESTGEITSFAVITIEENSEMALGYAV